MKIKGTSGKVTLPQGIIYNVRAEIVEKAIIIAMSSLLHQYTR